MICCFRHEDLESRISGMESRMVLLTFRNFHIEVSIRILITWLSIFELTTSIHLAFFCTVYLYFVAISMNVCGRHVGCGVCTGLIVWFSARYLDIKKGAGKDNTIFRIAEYNSCLKYDILIWCLLSYLWLEVWDLTDNFPVLLWSEI